MPKPAGSRTYGKQSKRSRAQRLFVELAQSPVRHPPKHDEDEVDPVSCLSEKLDSIHIVEESPAPKVRRSPRKSKVSAQILQDTEEEEVPAVVEPTTPIQSVSPSPTPVVRLSPLSSSPTPLVEADGET